ncbi:sugar efflux transporter [Vibrio hannami]|uniref:sugar efflux transporter n=1 Tax=Vibrio hannami TaxID=2717094 RepID=UPI00240EC079|nr:sugar efflux transporter [Vibrio hannami]MDG3084825.1 sugar efflux transporter [Vibrio hannami]
MYRDKTALLFIFTAFLSGASSSFFYPLSSLFIIEALDAKPAMLSLYMALAVCSSVIVSQFIASHSDKGWPRKKILLVALGCYLITVSSFSWVRDYYVAVAIAVLFGSVSGAASGQLFALGREYGDKHLKNSTSFVATMRAGIAIAWVFGPPVAFMLKGSFGFSISFLTSAAMTSLCMTIVALFIPNSRQDKSNDLSKEKSAGSNKLNRNIVLYCIALVLMFSANNLYINSMPLYLSKELLIDASKLGFLFGLAALCEIPVMMNAGTLAARFGAAKMLSIGLGFACLFYIVVLSATEFWMLAIAQLFNGIFIGLSATLGMVVLQNLMKDRLGFASTLFTNMLQVSMLVASMSIGIAGEYFSYHSAFFFCLTGAACALILMLYFLNSRTLE